MGRFSGKPRANHERGPGGIFIEKRADGFEEKGQVLLVRVPAADGDSLILFGDSGVGFEDIGLNGVRNAVDFGGIDPETGGEGFPKCGGMRSFDEDGGQEFQSFS